MAFNHVTVGIDSSFLLRNRFWPLENCTLTSLGVAVALNPTGFNGFNFRCGLTPPGDEAVNIYQCFLSGRLSPSDGLHWSGSIRLRENMFIVLNYISDFAGFVYVTWTTA